MLIKELKKNNFTIFIFITISAFFIGLSGCSRKNVSVMPPNQSIDVSAPTTTPVNSNKSANSNQRNGNKNMNDAKTPIVSAGNWGATGISMIVEENGAKIEYDCANGEIKEKLTVNENGEFEVDGTHTRESFGPVREDNPPKSKPAHYAGKISGDVMTLKVTFTDTKEEIGEFTLGRDKFARLRKCQ